ncbi:MAG: type II secretion system protein [Elusimicrobia bacterium]|nr:type II secretion system protein [Elusimicrobiota bacterium]
MKKGFTLIEIMIVVTVIGILVTIAVPKFTDLMRRAKEGSTKGNLGVIRSIVNIYYAKNEAFYPPSLEKLVTEYIEQLPVARIGAYGHPDRRGEITATDDSSLFAGWVYPDSTSHNFGKVWVNCTHTDTKRETISAW